jgi:hypothetical protein
VSEPDVVPQKTFLGRARLPLALVIIATISLASYYVLFFERKTAYYTERNARILATLADQLRQSIEATSGYVKQATDVSGAKGRTTDDSNDERKNLFIFSDATHRAKMPAALFSKIECDEGKVTDKKPTDDRPHLWSERTASGLLLHFNLRVKSKHCSAKFAESSIDLRRLVDPIVQQSSAMVFDSFFILDSSGNVVYQRAHTDDERGHADDGPTKIVRLRELTERRWLEKERPLHASDLNETSRQTAVRLSDTDYQFFSVPLRSGMPVEDLAPPSEPRQLTEAPRKVVNAAESASKSPPSENGRAMVQGSPVEEAKTAPADDTWVLCGIVREVTFRASSLAISVTLVSMIAALVLLLIFSCPFLKVTMINAKHRLATVDVIMLGICGILASSILALTVFDWLTYSRVEENADHQLKELASRMEKNFNSDLRRISDQLDAGIKFSQLITSVPQTSGDPHGDGRYPDLLTLGGLDKPYPYPYIQGFTLVDKTGRQEKKWFVDSSVTPMVSVADRVYFSAARDGTSEYFDIGSGKFVAMQSVRSKTTGLQEFDFGRRTDAEPPSPKKWPVITMVVPDALSVGHPVLPLYFGFAIVDASGQVQFHSDRHRNTIENFFDESDRDRQLRSAVTARREETMDIRYWGEDYRAYVRPMTGLPWTIITFREKRGLRTMNTEALIVTMVFLIILTGPGLLSFILLVLLLRPRYSAKWLWPDAARVRDYVLLIETYAALLVASVALAVLLRRGSLILLPYWLVPLVLVTTYVRLAKRRSGVKRWGANGAIGLLLSIAATSAIVGKLDVAGPQWLGRAVALVLVAFISVAIVLPPRKAPVSGSDARIREQAALPLVYCATAFLLLLLTSVVPTLVFFKGAYDVQMTSFVKSVQMQFAHDLQARWWRLATEYSNDRGAGKEDLLKNRRKEKGDIYDAPSFHTTYAPEQLDALPIRKAASPGTEEESAFPEYVEGILPHYSEASVYTRELIHDRSSDNQWWWKFNDPSHMTLFVNGQGGHRFTLSSTIPRVFLGIGGRSEGNTDEKDTAANAGVAFLIRLVVVVILLGASYWIAQFIARRVFLVDLVSPRWKNPGVMGLRHVICYPCDDNLALKLFADYAKVDLRRPEDYARLDTLPQSFPKQPFEELVLIDGLDYKFTSGERANIVRSFMERLTRNADRTVVLRPSSMNVITNGILQGTIAEEWSKLLASFVWVSGYQLDSDRSTLTLSGSVPPVSEDTGRAIATRWRRLLRTSAAMFGFASYVDQIMEPQNTAARVIEAETENDPYLRSLALGLDSGATARDQVLEEISERAEPYYTALWHSCSTNEKIVLLQLAQTGLANDKMRKDVRRLLARGLIRRDPRLRTMNETFRRFVLEQASNASLAIELQPTLVTDAWQRFRIPFFVTVVVVTLFFVVTQHELFDATLAMVTGVTASLPALAKIASAFGDRAARSFKG